MRQRVSRREHFSGQCDQGAELSAAVELRRLFPGVTDMAEARECARTIAGRKPLPVRPRSGRGGIPGGFEKAPRSCLAASLPASSSSPRQMPPRSVSFSIVVASYRPR
jgi:hypothetical protein